MEFQELETPFYNVVFREGGGVQDRKKAQRSVITVASDASPKTIIVFGSLFSSDRHLVTNNMTGLLTRQRGFTVPRTLQRLEVLSRHFVHFHLISITQSCTQVTKLGHRGKMILM